MPRTPAFERLALSREGRVYRPFSVPYNELAAKKSAPALYRNAEDVFGAGVALPAPSG